MMKTQFVIYIIEGILLFLCSCLFLLSTLTHRSLRFRYVILISQFFTGAICGLAELLAGAGRLSVLISNYQTLKSRQHCMLMPWNIFLLWSDPMSAIVLLITSIDRLCAVAFPIPYYMNPRRFQFGLIASSHSFIVVCMIVCWSTAVTDTTPMFSPLCWSSSGMQPFYATFSHYLQIFSITASVVIYVAVFIISRRHSIRIQNSTKSTGLRQFAKRQTELTITLGISCIFTTILYIAPVCVEEFTSGKLDEWATEFITMYSLISTNLNPIVNMLIITRRHNEIADSLKVIICCMKKSNMKPIATVSTLL